MPASGSLTRQANRPAWRSSSATVPSVEAPSTTIHSNDTPRWAPIEAMVYGSSRAALSVEVTMETSGVAMRIRYARLTGHHDANRRYPEAPRRVVRGHRRARGGPFRPAHRGGAVRDPGLSPPAAVPGLLRAAALCRHPADRLCRA